ncbi:hypothetical protein B5M09_001893 [Aphanomyces astaci]|uniref:Uncharacterized protein n=1 Tax=Aphanomyces astaci TaxID=112090 RepID=A0A425D931_APHAT|nr:hypothetical protein B5M09_001893 [Aphanomyces astaci]
MYMESLESATINDSFYNSLLKFHSNQESPLSPPRTSASSPLVVSPFSVHNVVATDSFFHPESEIEAFQGLKKGEMSPPPPHAQPRSSSIKPSKRGDKKDVRPLPSRSSMSRADKLPALKSTVTKRDVHMTSTRSNPDLALYADPRRRDDLLDLFDSDDAVQTTIHRSESAPSASSTITHSPDRDSPATTPNLTPNGHATNHGDGAVVPRLNFNPFTSRESKTTIMHHESKKASADHGKAADQKRTHKANPKAGKKVAYPSVEGAY